MVVVLIIGILMAIAIPTFLSAQKGAGDKTAQANLTSGLTAEASYYNTNQAYADQTNPSALAMHNAEPNVNWTEAIAGAQTAALATNQVGVVVPTGTRPQTVTMVTQDAQYCFYIVQTANAGAQYGNALLSGGFCPPTPAAAAAPPVAYTQNSGLLTFDEKAGWAHTLV